jgi:hypothetical protein
MSIVAIALNGAWGAGETCPGVALDSVVDGEREIAVGGGRDRSRQVVGHAVDDNAARPTARRLSPIREDASLPGGHVFQISGICGSPDEKRK